MALRRAMSSSSTGGKYALVANYRDKGLFLCNIRSGEVTSVDFPLPVCDSVVKFLSTCRGLALVQASARHHWHGDGDGHGDSLIIGNPVQAKWKTLQSPPFKILRANAGLGRRHNSVHVIGFDFHTRKSWTYDFSADRWSPGPNHRGAWDLESNLAWHRGSFYALYSEASYRRWYSEEEENDPAREMSFEEWYQTDESKMEECERIGLFRCQLGRDKCWTPVELSSPVKRLLGGWLDVEQRLIVHKDKLLLYMWNGVLEYKADPRLTRRQVQRMFELLDDGRIVEDASWIDAADKFDPAGDCIPFESWCDVVYGDKKDDFFWHPRTGKDIMLHSGVDGSVMKIDAPGYMDYPDGEYAMRISDITGFEDYLDGESDAFLNP